MLRLNIITNERDLRRSFAEMDKTFQTQNTLEISFLRNWSNYIFVSLFLMKFERRCTYQIIRVKSNLFIWCNRCVFAFGLIYLPQAQPFSLAHILDSFQFVHFEIGVKPLDMAISVTECDEAGFFCVCLTKKCVCLRVKKNCK